MSEIKPHPNNDLSLNLLVLGAEIIRILRPNKKRFTLVEDVMDSFLKNDPHQKRTPSHFLDALTYLFVVGLIEQQGYKVRLKKGNDYTQLHLF